MPRRAVRWFTQLATENKVGSFFNSLAAIVFSAFQVEGAINHASSKAFSNFDRASEFQSWAVKLRRLADLIKWTEYQTHPTHRSVTLAFEVRHAIAHPKNERILTRRQVTNPDNVKGLYLVPSWEELCRAEAAAAIGRDCDAFCRELVERVIAWGPKHRPDVNWRAERYEGSGLQWGSISVVERASEQPK